MQIVSIIRERGQLTIPESVRKIVGWANPMSAVSITVTKADEIIIKPHSQFLDWEQIWANIRKSRAISGKGKISASKFLKTDRSEH